MKTKLNVGSGYRPLAKPDNEWEDLDIRESVNPTIVADVRHIPRENETYDIVLAHSVLEHFSKREVTECITEWRRVLKTGGQIRISVPDMERVAKDLFETQSELKKQNLINLIYGEQDFSENTHKWGFTEESLGRTLRRAGFVDIERMTPERYSQELFLVATKK